MRALLARSRGPRPRPDHVAVLRLEAEGLSRQARKRSGSGFALVTLPRSTTVVSGPTPRVSREESISGLRPEVAIPCTVLFARR
jgi:hypothetical protein